MSEPLNGANAEVLLYEHTAGDSVVAEARFNAEATLNALSLEMINALMPVLDRWEADERVRCVVLRGAGDRAFSAGGDIQALYRAMVANHQAGERVDDYPYEFFEWEYRLDHRLHTFPKPVVALGHGVIMGGGLGMFSASSHRVVAENVRIAMPEVTIGLFPDAGATWLLRNMPEHMALFLGMTGSQINAADALELGLGTHGMPASEHDGVVDALRNVPWNDVAPERAGEQISAVLANQQDAQLPESNLGGVPEVLSADASLLETVARIREAAGQGRWFERAADTLERGCPTSVAIVPEQLRRSRALDLAGCFRMEMTLATHCADNHDFAEGIRALLIDKDNAPNWQFTDLESLPEPYVVRHFEEPWPNNPLHDLEVQR